MYKNLVIILSSLIELTMLAISVSKSNSLKSRINPFQLYQNFYLKLIIKRSLLINHAFKINLQFQI